VSDSAMAPAADRRHRSHASSLHGGPKSDNISYNVVYIIQIFNLTVVYQVVTTLIRKRLFVSVGATRLCFCQ